MALQDNDGADDGDLISVNGQPTDTQDDGGTTAVDRGDVVNPELNQENLRSLVADGGDAASTDDAGAEPANRPNLIPKARFDEVNNRKNDLAEQLLAAQQEIARLTTPAPATTTTSQAPAAVFDEAGREEEYAQALIDGDTKLAAQIRVEINNNIRVQATNDFEVQQEHRRVVQSVQAVTTQALADYPYLDTPEGEEALDLIISARDRRISNGMQAAEALREAVAAIAPRFLPVATPGRDLNDGGAQTDTRTANALARGAADSNRQPPSVQLGAGNRAAANRVDVEDLTDEQFDNLSAADKKRMRGDL
jgi:hypothetical protein